MSFITFGKSFSEVQEQKPVPAGIYHLRAVSVDGYEKNGKQSLKIMHEIEGHPEAGQVSHFLNLPVEGDEKLDIKMLFIKRYLAAFHVPMEDNGFNPDDILGAEADVSLSLTEPREGSSAVYNQIDLPKLADEGATPLRRAAGGKKR